MSRRGVYTLPERRRSGPVLVVAVGAAAGSRSAAAALACAGSEPDRAGLLIDLAPGRLPRPSLVATAGARRLEERLVAHLPEAAVASRGAICLLAAAGAPFADPGAGADRGFEAVAAALPLVRDAVAAIHLPPDLLQGALDDARIGGSAALLRADLAADRALTALAARDLIERDLRVAVLKRPLGWLAARRALFGALPAAGLPPRLRERLLP